jgi:hypothetical protein
MWSSYRQFVGVRNPKVSQRLALEKNPEIKGQEKINSRPWILLGEINDGRLSWESGD